MPRTARDLVPSRSLVQALHQSHVFRDVPEEDVPEEAVLDLAAALRPCAWRPGRVFIGSGTADGGVYFLAAGLALLCGLSPDGQQIALDLLQAGDLFGIALWTRRSACRSCRSWAALRRWLVARPAALDAWLSQSVRLRVGVQQRILELATCSVRVRLAHVLARLGPAGLVSGL